MNRTVMKDVISKKHGDAKRKPPSYVKQKDEVLPLLNKRLVKNDIW